MPHDIPYGTKTLQQSFPYFFFQDDQVEQRSTSRKPPFVGQYIPTEPNVDPSYLEAQNECVDKLRREIRTLLPELRARIASGQVTENLEDFIRNAASMIPFVEYQ